jgi:lysozyme family protein
MNFDRCLEIVLHHEGGYVNHPDDPGGETNFGITVKVARINGYEGLMRDIPMDVVRVIYRKDYWIPCRCEELPDDLRLAVFDAAVNSGVRRSIQWLQASVGATADGIFGPRTMLSVKQHNPQQVAARLCAARLDFLAGLQHFPTFGRGWVRRVVSILRSSM